MADNIKEMYWEMIIKIIKTTTNDAELAAEIRKLYWLLPDYLKK